VLVGVGLVAAPLAEALARRLKCFPVVVVRAGGLPSAVVLELGVWVGMW
jgi:hypothetical protein